MQDLSKTPFEKWSEAIFHRARQIEPGSLSAFLDTECGVKSYVRMDVQSMLDGQTLANRIASQPLLVPEIIDVGIALADALKLAHLREISHGDIRPENILLLSKARIVLLNFQADPPSDGISRDIVAIGSVLQILLDGTEAPDELRSVANRAADPSNARGYSSGGHVRLELSRFRPTIPERPYQPLRTIAFWLTLLGLSIWLYSWVSAHHPR